MRARSFIIILLPLFAACVKDNAMTSDVDPPFTVHLPMGAPQVPVPADNALTQARVTLGKLLFFDPRLSNGNDLSCASCHHADRAFSDTSALSLGANGAHGFRNAPSLANVAYLPALFRDGGVPTLELQVLAPMQDAHEMASNINAVVGALRDVEPFASLSKKAYDRRFDGYVITRAIASYERTLISGWSRFDRFQYQNDQSALSEEELRGWNIFNGADANCAACHSGSDLSDHDYHNIGTSIDHTADPGRERITLLATDRGKFKTPTLRNIALTAPYMHDGGMSTLDQVIDHFASGGVNDLNKSPLMHAFTLTAQDKADLIAFLRALTDDRSLDQVP